MQKREERERERERVEERERGYNVFGCGFSGNIMTIHPFWKSAPYVRTQRHCDYLADFPIREKCTQS